MKPLGKLLLSLLPAMLLASCAQTMPPVPPSLELPKPVTDLKASRKGDKVYLRWTVPVQTTDGESVRSLGVTRICRSLDVAAKGCEQVGEVAAAKAPTPHGKTGAAAENSFVDSLSSEDVRDASRVLNYSVAVFNGSGRTAGLSNRGVISAAPTLPAPSEFKIQLTADGVELSWQAVTPNPALHNFYRIYRRQEGSGGDVVAGEIPVDASTSQLVDRGFEWEKTYYYHATIVTEVSAGMQPCGNKAKSMDCATVYQVEGEDTPVIKVFADDKFPPAAPAGLQAVFSGEGQKPFVDLVWAPNTEADLAGYRVYRREQGGQERILSSEPIKVPAFRDSDVQSGKQYFYSITAVDARGNESGRSEEASEQVP